MATTQWIEAAFVRGGTSKGLFFRDDLLPAPGPERDALLASALGSPDRFGRQLDGMGGGVSSLSKVMSVRAADRSPGSGDPDADLIYTFGQVAVDRAAVDYSGNCGNLSSGVVPFALHAGLLRLPDGPQSVALFNTNTGKQVVVRLAVEGGEAETEGGFALPGVSGTGSPIELVYPDPAGSRTSGLLPTGRPIDVLRAAGREIEASLVDAALALVIVRAADLGLTGAELPAEIDADRELSEALEALRQEGAVRMGLAESAAESPDAVPKIVLVGEPRDSRLLDGSTSPADEADVLARTLSMRRAHGAVPGTGAMCLAAAASTPGTVVERIAGEVRPSARELRIGTPSGVVTAAADTAHGEVTSASLFRTARVLMSGRVAARAQSPVQDTEEG